MPREKKLARFFSPPALPATSWKAYPTTCASCCIFNRNVLCVASFFFPVFGEGRATYVQGICSARCAQLFLAGTYRISHTLPRRRRQPGWCEKKQRKNILRCPPPSSHHAELRRARGRETCFSDKSERRRTSLVCMMSSERMDRHLVAHRFF